jgi:hypothetical protein
MKIGSHNGTETGLTLPAGAGRHRPALTFHCSNGLLKPLHPSSPRRASVPLILQWNWRVFQADRPARGSLSRSSSGYTPDEFCDLIRDGHDVAYHDGRGRPDSLLCYKTFHMFQC